MMLTVTLAWPVPPAPVQVSVKVVAVVRLPVLCVPAVAFVPVQPPDAVHDVAFVDDHVSVLAELLLTDVGAAVSVAVGAGVAPVTDTDALAWPEPPLPVQLSVNVAFAFKAPVLSLPETAFAPLQPPLAEQVV